MCKVHTNLYLADGDLESIRLCLEHCEQGIPDVWRQRVRVRAAEANLGAQQGHGYIKGRILSTPFRKSFSLKTP